MPFSNSRLTRLHRTETHFARKSGSLSRTESAFLICPVLSVAALRSSSRHFTFCCSDTIDHGLTLTARDGQTLAQTHRSQNRSLPSAFNLLWRLKEAQTLILFRDLILTEPTVRQPVSEKVNWPEQSAKQLVTRIAYHRPIKTTSLRLGQSEISTQSSKQTASPANSQPAR